VDGEVLLDVHQGQIFCLNVVGAKILSLFERGNDAHTIAEQISREYAVERATVHAHVTEFIEALQKHRILQSADPPTTT